MPRGFVTNLYISDKKVSNMPDQISKEEMQK
jgi:hypothetical protein